MLLLPLVNDPDEYLDLRSLIGEVVANPETWMDTPHDLLGGKRPNELIATPYERLLRELVRSIKHGIPA